MSNSIDLSAYDDLEPEVVSLKVATQKPGNALDMITEWCEIYKEESIKAKIEAESMISSAESVDMNVLKVKGSENLQMKSLLVEKM